MNTTSPTPQNETLDDQPWNGVFREEIDDDDGVGYALVHYRDGKIHRDDDEPAYTRFGEDGQITEQGWYTDGVRCRKDGPATILYDDNGEKGIEEWLDENGELHNTDDRPAVIVYQSGAVAKQSWYHRGQLHREGDKPAELCWDDDGTVLAADFYIHGKADRAVGPASYHYNAYDNLETEHWQRDGRQDRADGPAFLSVETYQDDDGNWHYEIVGETWYRNGQAHEPSAHDRLRWQATQIRQGGLLWPRPKETPESFINDLVPFPTPTPASQDER
jgi:hypothetical protein